MPHPHLQTGGRHISKVERQLRPLRPPPVRNPDTHPLLPFHLSLLLANVEGKDPAGRWEQDPAALPLLLSRRVAETWNGSRRPERPQWLQARLAVPLGVRREKKLPLLCLQEPRARINTEEHVDAADQEVILWDHNIPEDILREITKPKEVPAESVTVWIDPLDATQEYTEDLRKYVTTMVCVAVNGEPVLGVIHKPFSAYTAWAMVDGGSNVKARTSYNEKTPRIIVSRSHSGTVKQVALQTFGNQTTIIPAGGAGYKVLSLLDVPDENQEKADIYIHVTYIKKWDICAGNALLKALGGHMTTLSGEEISYTGSDGNEGGLLASINMNHQALVRKLPDLEKTSHK
uniref:Golgi-resident adenosine 3',5'-bisphosphate 3'-phosphatase n=1 Tax=Monodelphis domestica TaxID=13616 RepID=A0A5F8G3N6_MONDO